MSIRTLVTVVLAAGAVAIAGAQPKPQVADILKTASAYLTEDPQKLSVTAEEDYVQRDLTTKSVNRRLQSDMVLVGIDDGAVIGFRDAFAVDGSQVRPRDERLANLFRKGMAHASQDAAKAIENETVRYYITPNLRVLDMPALPLEFLREQHRDGSEFELDGVKTTDGVQVATVKFTMRPSGSVLPTPPGSKTSGKFWIDVATGTIRQSELTVEARNQFRFVVTTKYALDAAVGVWVPVEVLQDIDMTVAGTGGLSNMGRGGNMGSRLTVEGRAKYSKYKRLGT